ncbi:MAG: aminotransferase class V-fold PLP-dependent enzyme [Ginsengibacter sp.]
MNAGRRQFLQQLGLATSAFTSSNLFNLLHAESFKDANKKITLLSHEQIAGDEDYWSIIQQAYTVNPNQIELNNGGVSPSPRIVQEALERSNKFINEGPSYYMWRILDQGREPLRGQLADLAGTSPEEIAINRNTTESLITVIYGLNLNRGDEVIGTRQDYPNMINAWKQRQSREGIIYKQINLNLPIANDEEIVKAFEKAITPATKLIHITHVINWMGQIMPVKKIADMAHQKGLEVLVDGAHSFGLLDFKIPDLHADYFGTSLHKFLSAPIGTGMLWVKKNKIKNVWPLLCNDKPQSDDIRKFETIGTRSFAIEQAIGEAINFHNAIGSKRKQDRIHYLKNYWASSVQNTPGVSIHTSLDPKYSCAICGFGIKGLSPAEVDAKLFNTYKIHTTNIVWENISCVRVTPHVYTKKSDVDKLVKAINEIAAATDKT